MDPVTLVYCAAVCAVLAGAMPARLHPWLRFAIGAAVGVVAAGALPVLRGMAGPVAGG